MPKNMNHADYIKNMGNQRFNIMGVDKMMNPKEKSQKKLERYQKKCHEAYLSVKEECGGDLGTTRDERIHKLVEMASEYEGKICEKTDHINIELAGKVDEVFGIRKTDFCEFVNLGYRIKNAYLKEKAIEKYMMKLQEKQFSVIVRNAFFSSHCIDNVEPAIISPDETKIPDVKQFTSPEFDEYLEDAIRAKREIKEVLKPMYQRYSMAAEYASEWEIDKMEFKKLVDFEHYKDGGYPAENTKPKLYAIFEKFDEAARLMRKYGFKQFADLEKEFGISVTLTAPDRFKRDFSGGTGELDE